MTERGVDAQGSYPVQGGFHLQEGFHAFQPPVGDHCAALFPPRHQLGDFVRANQATRRAATGLISDIEMSLASQVARREAWRAAEQWAELADLPKPQSNLQPQESQSEQAAAVWIMTGHQPELFHPGVWYKDFVTHQLAQELSGHAFHLLTDNDLLRRTTIRAPRRNTLGEVGLEEIAWDVPSVPVPHEERTVWDKDLWSTFGDRIGRSLAGLIEDPMINTYWPRVQSRRANGLSPGHAFAAARLATGRDWGLDTIGVPLGMICDQSAFLGFVWHFLRDANRFQTLHNRNLEAYRRQFHLRSQSHPVPALRTGGEGIEVPFWIWNSADPRRRALFVRGGDRVHLLAGPLEGDRRHARDGGWSRDLGIDFSADPQRGVSALLDLRREGIKIRPRALTTTMFARLLLSDLFVHGVGGAKYDILTDRLIADFWDFGVDPPVYAAATATLKLPLPVVQTTHEDLLGIDHRLREIRFHPEKVGTRGATDADEALHELLRQKEELLQNIPQKGCRKEWHAAVAQVNEGLGVHWEEIRQGLLEQRSQVQRAYRQSKALSSREFAYCLFPESELSDVLLDISQAQA